MIDEQTARALWEGFLKVCVVCATVVFAAVVWYFFVRG